MPIKTHTFQILDDEDRPHEYLIEPFKASEGLKIQQSLLHVVGPSIGHTAGAIKGLNLGGSVAEMVKDLNLDGDNLASAIEGFALRIVQQGNDALWRQLVSECRRQNAKGGWISLNNQTHFDIIYAANYGELYRVVAKVLEVNFAPFVKRLKALIQSLKEDETTPSSSESSSEQNELESIGESGESG